MSTTATATDSAEASDDYFDETARTASRHTEDATAGAGSANAGAAAAGAAATFDPTATARLPNTTDGANRAIR